MADQKFIPSAPLSQDELHSEVELTISAKNLLNKDSIFVPKAICVTYMQNQNSHAWSEYARTERAMKGFNPEFVTKIQIRYHCEDSQKIRFKIYHVYHENKPFKEDNFLGETESSLGHLVSSGTVTLKLNHPDSKNEGQLCIKTEEVGSVKEEVEFQFSAENLKKDGLIFKSAPDPFLAIYKEDCLLYYSQFIKGSCNPVWPKFAIPLRWLRTKDGQDVTLKLKCWYYDGNGFENKLLGEVQTTTSEILDAPKSFLLNYKNSANGNGKLCLHQTEVKTAFTFMDYIRFGTRLHCTIAIDFTGSTTPLHVIGASPSVYEQVLMSVVPIIQEYDSDKQFPVLGFGTKLPPAGNVSNEFFVNFNSSNPYCAGLDGVIEAYRKCLHLIKVENDLQCDFVPVIKHVNRFAASQPNGDHYFILLILTHNDFFDESPTKNAIIAASHSPMSIIIVGIGNKSFELYKKLDSNKGLLKSKGNSACRDIVQFVPYQFFLDELDPYTAVADLTRCVVGNIPKQLVDYMKLKNLAPKRP